MAKPIVIDMKDGETRNIEARCDGNRAFFRVRARGGPLRKANESGPYPCVNIDTANGMECIHIPLSADPARAAVQAERKRIGKLVLHHFDDGDKRAWLLSAIDAPPEVVSEYARGHRDGQKAMQKHAVKYLYGVAEARQTDTESHPVSLVRGSAKWIDEWEITEPLQ